MCKRKKPSTAVVCDSALDPVDRYSTDGRCRNPREPNFPFATDEFEEIAGIRADYERILNPETCEYTSPKEPDFSEIVGDCDWEQKGVYGFAPSGRVSKTDPRFGVLNIGCITGSVDGMAALCLPGKPADRWHSAVLPTVPLRAQHLPRPRLAVTQPAIEGSPCRP